MEDFKQNLTKSSQGPELKEIIDDEVLGTIKVFENGLYFENKFFPNYEGLELGFETENNEIIPVKIEETDGFDVEFVEFTENKEAYLTHLKRIRSFEKTIMDEMISYWDNEIASDLDFVSDEFRNSLINITISMNIELVDTVISPDDAVVNSNAVVLSENGARDLFVVSYVDLNDGSIEFGYSDSGFE